jgi:hypothetical protein
MSYRLGSQLAFSATVLISALSTLSIRIYMPFSLVFILWVNIFLPGLQSGTEVEIALLQYAAKGFCTLKLLALRR